MDDLLVAARAVHFATTSLVAGVVLFRWLVADTAGLRRRLAIIVLVSLTLSLLSGIAWLLAVAATIGRAALANTVSLLLTETQFGHAWLVRLLLAGLLLAGVMRRSRILLALSAVGLMGALAWSGHAAGTPGIRGDFHRLADFLHLLAAAAWLGGLLPLFLLLRLGNPDDDLISATKRFSTVGLVSVGTLLITGSINAWMLVPGPSALIETKYGILLFIKIALFAAMVAVAAVNRLRLTPGLPSDAATRALSRNVLIELMLGLAVLTIVGLLGTLPPGGHAGMH